MLPIRSIPNVTYSHYKKQSLQKNNHYESKQHIHDTARVSI